MSDKDICDEILASGLRGRGGGGFPTGKKWDLTRAQPGPKKYIFERLKQQHWLTYN